MSCLCVTATARRKICILLVPINHKIIQQESKPLIYTKASYIRVHLSLLGRMWQPFLPSTSQHSSVSSVHIWCWVLRKKNGQKIAKLCYVNFKIKMQFKKKCKCEIIWTGKKTFPSEIRSPSLNHYYSDTIAKVYQ